MLIKEMEELEKLFAEQCSLVEKMVEKAVTSLLDRDEDIACEVIEFDEQRCNALEKEIEKKATDIIALYSPRAGEMRKLVSIMKANRDLERMGDQAENIAHSALYLIPRIQVKPLIDIPRMAEIVRQMISLCLDAFLQENIKKAERALEIEESVDQFNLQIIRELITYMAGDPKTIERAMKLIFITRNLERIGDLSTNLAEEVVYYITGSDIRHQDWGEGNEENSNS